MKFLWAVGYIAALGILAHIVGQALPRRWFDPDRFPYRCAPWSRTGASGGSSAYTAGRITSRT